MGSLVTFAGIALYDYTRPCAKQARSACAKSDDPKCEYLARTWCLQLEADPR